MPQTPVAVGNPSDSQALPFSALHLGLWSLLPRQRPQSAGWLTHTLSRPVTLQIKLPELRLGKVRLLPGHEPGCWLCDWRMISKFYRCQ